jgi:hypothetical protein
MTIPEDAETIVFKAGRSFVMKPCIQEISLRDYFAAKAMAALICETLIANNERIELSFDDVVKKTTNASYDIADAMIKAREVEQ